VSLAPIREYFKARILEVDADFREHKNPFNTDDLSANEIHKSFHIQASGLSGNRVNQGTTDDTLQFTVSLFFTGGSDLQVNVDEGFDIGNSVRLKAMSPKKMALAPSIRRVFCSSVEPVPMPTNQNTFSVVMVFAVQAGFALG
jgi:hypothetical protein